MNNNRKSWMPPDSPISMEAIKLKNAIKRWGILGLLLIILGITVFSSLYVLDSGKVAVVTTFGKYSRTEKTPGLRFLIPFVEKKDIVDVSTVRRMEFGYRTRSDGTMVDVFEESTMLTGDECLVIADWTIQYKITDSYQYLYNVESQEETLRIFAESAYRRVVASHILDDILTDKKDQIQNEVLVDLQDICNRNGLGVAITGVQLQDAMPPEEVKASFLDVTSAKEDKAAKVNEARRYENEKLPVARGDAQKIIADAEAYKQARINEATGIASRYRAIAEEYEKMPSVMRMRMYIEMITEVLPRIENLYIVDGNGNTVQFLPLNPSNNQTPVVLPQE